MANIREDYIYKIDYRFINNISEGPHYKNNKSEYSEDFVASLEEIMERMSILDFFKSEFDSQIPFKIVVYRKEANEKQDFLVDLNWSILDEERLKKTKIAIKKMMTENVSLEVKERTKKLLVQLNFFDTEAGHKESKSQIVFTKQEKGKNILLQISKLVECYIKVVLKEGLVTTIVQELENDINSIEE